MQYKEMGQGPHRFERAAAGLRNLSLCSREGMVRPDRGLLIQETDFIDRESTIVVTV